MVSTPRPPDPMQTAQAQSGLNTDTALTSQLVNQTNTVNPWGSTTYSQDGSASFTNSQGQTVSVPRFTQTTTLSPEQQTIFDRSQGAQANIAGIAQDQSARIGEYLNDPFEFDNQGAADWAYDLAQSRIAPQQAQDRASLDTRLIERGIRPGSAAYDREMARMDRSVTDQRNQLALTGRSQAFSEALARRNQPINEITALLSGSQVSNPASMSAPTPQTSVGGVDYTGLVQSNYQQQMANRGSMLGGLFGLAGSLGGAAIASDRRLKADIRRVGSLDNGLPVYAYRYRWGGPVHIGVMAQDVEIVAPEAVSEIAGYKAVDYARAVA